MSQTDLLSIVRSLDAVFTATSICYTVYVDGLLADSQHSASYWLPLYERRSLLVQNQLQSQFVRNINVKSCDLR
jgi:hypothetical protein